MTNPTIRLTDSNLEIAGLVILWLVIEGLCHNLNKKQITLFSDNSPTQSWTVYYPNRAVVTRVISALRMKHFALDAWRRLSIRGRCVGKIGAPMSNTWTWIRTYSKSHPQHESNASQDLQPAHKQSSIDTDNRSRVAQSLALSLPLARQLLWPATKT